MLEFRSRELTLVRRLRIAGAGLDPVTSRLRAGQAFASLDLAGLGLPPSAVLCIRALADPRPGSCRFGPEGLRLTTAWRDSLRSEIERRARRASRPARERVAASADCVLFADASELLAAAAEDWLSGRAHARWWWNSLLGAAASGARALPGLWLREPEYVPGALEHLAAKGRAAEFVRRLPAGEARAILRRVAAAFSLREPEAAPARVASPPARAGSTPFDERSDARAGGGSGARPPWHELVPECAGARLDAAGERLLGIGLSLSRAPALARREDFARRAAEWARHAAQADARGYADASREHGPRVRPAVATASATRARGEVERGPHGLPAPTHPAPDTRGEQVRAQGGDAAHTPAHTPDAGARNERRPAGGVDGDEGMNDARSQNVIARAAETGAGDRGGDATETVVSRGASADDSRGAELDPRRGAAGESAAESSRREASDAPVLEAEIETRFGGLFHLVNLGLFLNLYGDFTTPAAPGLPLPLWDFVALLGRRLAGARVERDAIWPLLARLSGRGEGDEPGANFSPPDEWRVPADWAKPFGAACVLRWSETGGRLRVAHPAGFTLLDVALDEPTTRADVESRLMRELRPYLEAGARFETRRVARVRGARGRTARARWLDRLSAYASARLALALGAAGASRLSSLLCERHARVFVTAAHVDVVMRLGELPLEVRFAGLDRDPGWVPAAGRHVAFHFE